MTKEKMTKEKMTKEIEGLEEKIKEKDEIERTTMEDEVYNNAPIINAISFDRDKVYIIQISEKWLERYGGTDDHIKRGVGKKIGRMILSHLSQNDIKAIVLIGEAIHIYDTEKKLLEEVLKDVRDRSSIGKDDSGEEGHTQVKLD